MSGFTDAGRPVSDAMVCPNIFSFVSFMAARVAAQRGGATSDHIRECAEFMEDVVGKRLTISDPLPAEYDWSVASARESAEQMMENDA